jgi:hypothetical protein
MWLEIASKFFRDQYFPPENPGVAALKSPRNPWHGAPPIGVVQTSGSTQRWWRFGRQERKVWMACAFQWLVLLNVIIAIEENWLGFLCRNGCVS